MKVLVTGATGFIGQALVPALLAEGHDVVATGRQAGRVAGQPVRAVGDLAAATDWAELLHGCDAVVHLAARVHVMDSAGAAQLDAFRRVNVEATRRLAADAARAGVRRLVFVSSVKVHGEHSPGRALTEADPPDPQDPYAVSKAEAELALRRVATETGLEVVILRPPLVYGPGVQANFAALVRVIGAGVPLPLGAVGNRRSLVYVENLCDAIACCLAHPAAAGETFLVDDGEAVSTPGLIRAVASAMGRPARLLPVPPAWLRLAGRLTGRSAGLDRLLSDLEVNSGRLRRVCGWTPRQDLRSALRASFGSWKQGGG